MAITINWDTRVISIPKSFMTELSPTLYELDLNDFRLALKDLEDDMEGMSFPITHNHNTEVTLAGITFARTIEIINDYTVTFEDGQYAVNAVGANSNIADVMNLNQVSLRTANSAGLITVTSGSGLSVEEHDELMAIRGADDDTLKTLSDQFDSIASTISSIYLIDQLLLAFIRNKKYLSKVGLIWYLIIRNDGDTTDILKKELKDKDGNNITDLAAGILAQELASSV